MINTVRVTRVLKATPEDVFQAWTDPRLLRQWLCLEPGVVGEVTCDPVVGGTYRLVMVFDHGASEVTGEYLEVDPPHRLVFTWRTDRTAGQHTRVTVTIRRDGDLTAMTIIHDWLPSDTYRDSASWAWTNVVDRLDRILTVRTVGP
jgi:uncharacterized protein YndB with AHSA1/START domain